VEAQSGEVLFSSFATLDRDLVLAEAEKYVIVMGGRLSPILAGIGSALIPGLGQVYAERPYKGAFVFGLATAGLISALSADKKAGDHRDEHEASRHLYLSAVDPVDIVRFRDDMRASSESYQKATGSRDTLLLLTGIVYSYGIFDAVRSAGRHNRGMKEQYALSLSTSRSSVRVELTLRIR